jgi:hypothetical protein
MDPFIHALLSSRHIQNKKPYRCAHSPNDKMKLSIGLAALFAGTGMAQSACAYEGFNRPLCCDRFVEGATSLSCQDR